MELLSELLFIQLQKNTLLFENVCQSMGAAVSRLAVHDMRKFSSSHTLRFNNSVWLTRFAASVKFANSDVLGCSHANTRTEKCCPATAAVYVTFRT